MATAYGKIIMFFGATKWGWEEEFFWTAENGDITSILADAKGLALSRRAILSQNFDLEAVRVSATDAGGNTFFVRQNLITFNVTQALGPGLLSGSCTNPWIALNEHATSADVLYSREINIRGIPSTLTCMSENLPWPIPEALRGPLNEYNAYITRNAGQQVGQLQMRVRDIRNRQAAVQITDVTVRDDGKWLIQTATPIQVYANGGGPFNAGLGDVIHVFGPKKVWARGLSGDHRIINPFDPDSPNQYVLSGCQARRCTVDYLQDALAAGVGYIMAPINLVDPTRPIVKKTGLAHFGTRGRARSRVCC